MTESKVREIIQVGIGQIVGIGDYHSVIEYKKDRIRGTYQGIIKTIQVILKE